MASTFKTLLADDVVHTRTLLHEAIPITGTIASGTYVNSNAVEANIKNFSHGMFQSVYDYPYLSSSANHIFDITYGHSAEASASATDISDGGMVQNAKKLNIYNQMAQTLLGYDVSGNIQRFSNDAKFDHVTNPWTRMDRCFFVNFSRLLTKDEIKKGSFKCTLYTEGRIPSGSDTQLFGYRDEQPATNLTISDYQSGTEYRTSPAGDYGILYTSSATPSTNLQSASANVAGPSTGVPTGGGVGLLFYQAGVAVLSSSVFRGEFGKRAETPDVTYATSSVLASVKSGTITQNADAFRTRIHNIQFNNTIELNSSIYFCRINHNEFNYSSNPTYIDGSKIRVKNNPSDLPITYITSVGLYSADNELLAVAKLSEPIRKDPNTELTLRVRLDY
tara:strand:+ start:1110 stop:2282 length:1173 start_codon:yes stop_codon:yes gene_type:complete